MFCHKCGTQAIGGAKSCASCGPTLFQAPDDGGAQLIQEQESKRRAVACQAGNESDARVNGLKRRRRIALVATFSAIACGSVFLFLQWVPAANWMFSLGLVPILYAFWAHYKLQVELAKIEHAKQTAQGCLPARDQSILFLIISQALPPLLMLPLFFMPWDTFLIYWMVCGIAALSALSNLLTKYVLGWKANLRSLLTVAIFSAAVVAVSVVEAASKRYAEELAARLQRECKERGRCLPAPEGWRVEGNYARSTHGHWTFTYVTNADRSEFGLWVHMRYETEKCIHGGSTIPLSEVKSVFCPSDPKAPPSRWQYERMAD